MSGSRAKKLRQLAKKLFPTGSTLRTVPEYSTQGGVRAHTGTSVRWDGAEHAYRQMVKSWNRNDRVSIASLLRGLDAQS